MKFKSALLTQASGSVGGMTFSTNRGGLYIRTRAIPTDPNSPQQVVIRTAMGTLVNRWSNILTAFQRTNWNIYAANVPLTGPLGDPITVSGQNHYIRSNVPRIQAGNAIIDVAPLAFNTGTLSAVTVTNATEAGQSYDVNFTDADLWNAAGGFLLVQASRPVQPTIEFFRGPYRLAADINGPAVSPITIAAIFPFVATQRLYFRVRAAFPDGRLTEVQNLGPLAAVA